MTHSTISIIFDHCFSQFMSTAGISLSSLYRKLVALSDFNPTDWASGKVPDL